MKNVHALAYLTILVLAASAMVTSAAAQEEAAADAAKNAEAKAVETDPKTTTLEGAFVPVKSKEISVETKEWTELVVKQAVPHGAEVHKGEVLIEFDLDNFEAAIRDAEIDQRLGTLSVELAEIKLDGTRKSRPLSLAGIERAERNASQDFKRFVTGDRERRKQSLEFSVRSAENRLAYQEEELRQLEKMYKADELTEDTEEIILRRTRDAVESARFSLETTRRLTEKGIEVDLPRSQEELETALADAALALAAARETLPRELKQEQLQLEKLQLGHEKAEQKLQRLRGDAKRLRVTSPIDGIVYYGQAKQGVFADSATTAALLRPGGTPKPKSVLMTIVQPRPLRIEATVDEQHLRHVAAGRKTMVTPTAMPDLELKATVKQVSRIPIAAGKFAVTLTVDLPEEAGLVVPGMKCKVKLTEE